MARTKNIYTLVFILISLNICTNTARVSGAKIDCYPIAGASQTKCENLGCVWTPVVDTNTQTEPEFYGQELPPGTKDLELQVSEPWCYFPDHYVGYQVVKKEKTTSPSGRRIRLTRVRPSSLNDDIKDLIVDIEQIGAQDVLRVKIYDANKKRYEPELPKIYETSDNIGTTHEKPQDEFKIEFNQSGQLDIRRSSTGAILFSSDLTKLIFSDRFIQLNTEIDSPFVFGLGEHYDTFVKLANTYKTYSFYNTDRLTLPGGQRSYGSFPFYINLDSENITRAHGVYLRNSNGMDIVLQPDKSITFRPIGGILDFFIFLGPTANDVISQYQHLVGLPRLPPLWALGFHLCRYNYGSLDKTKLVWNRTRQAGIPFDVQWNDIDYMDKYNDFTYDHVRFRGLPEFIDEIHHNNMSYMILFDPGVSQEPNYYPYELGEQMDIFIKNATNQTLVGKVWNLSGRTVFPDFSDPKVHEYWSKLFKNFQQEIKFDGAWIDMNDISSFVDGSLDGCPKESPWERPPYVPGFIELQQHSLCLSAKHRAGCEYNLHNLYSFYEAIATRKALQAARPGRRSLIISRSTSPGQGHFGGHWSGDVLSNWNYLKWSIPSLLEHSIYGFSMIGSDICGFGGNTTPELCARWSTLGAFYTFSRNHNDDTSIDQDPVALGPEVVAANKNAQTKRYSLLPYLYTLIYRASKFGEPAARSVALEFFAQDKEALKIEYQFMWGKALMISPIVDENTYTKTTYLPKGRWYETDILPEAKNKPKVPKWIDSKGGAEAWFETSNIALTNLPIFYRGGHIVPFYPDVKQTIAETILQPVGLEVALCPMGRAKGQLYVDDGETDPPGDYNLFEMKVDKSTLNITKSQQSTFKKKLEFGEVKVFGLSSQVSFVELHALHSAKNITFNQQDHMLSFDLGALSVDTDQPIWVRWN